MYANDLFPDEAAAPRPDVLSEPRFLGADEHGELLAWCIAEVPWRDMNVNFGGNVVAVPRRLAWFGDVEYAYSGLRHPAQPMPGPIRALADKVEAWLAGQGHSRTFNSVLMNFYRDGNDAIGMHSDDETQLGAEPTIASVSLGAQRTFVFRHKETKLKLQEPLIGGSLLVMRGNTQREWLHGIPREPSAGGRVNLTFRNTYR